RHRSRPSALLELADRRPHALEFVPRGASCLLSLRERRRRIVPSLTRRVALGRMLLVNCREPRFLGPQGVQNAHFRTPCFVNKKCRLNDRAYHRSGFTQPTISRSSFRAL